jgi:hypothetical protein
LAEKAIATLARVLGGVVLLQGRLGHQVLGQLLLANTDDLAIAGASVVVAAASKSPNAVLRTVLQTAAPAAALHSLFARRQAQLQRQEQRLRAQEARWQADRRAGRARLRELDDLERRCRRERGRLLRRIRTLEGQLPGAVTRPARRRRAVLPPSGESG